MSGSQTASDPFAFTFAPQQASSEPQASQAAPAPVSTGGQTPDPLSFQFSPQIDPKNIPQDLQPYGGLIAKYATKYGVPVPLATALFDVESSGNPKAVSNKGAQGLGQLMAGTAKSVGVDNPFDPEQNIEGSMKYLSQLYNQTVDPKTKRGDWDSALRGYNGGPKAMGSGNLLEQGLNMLAPGWDQLAGPGAYAQKVIGRYAQLGGNIGDLQLEHGYEGLGIPSPGYGQAMLNGVLDGQLPKVQSGIDAGVGTVYDLFNPSNKQSPQQNFSNIFTQDMGNGAIPGVMTEGQNLFNQDHPVSAEAATLLGSAAPAALGGGAVNLLGNTVKDALPAVGGAVDSGLEGSGFGNFLLRALGNSAQGAGAGIATQPLNSGPQGTDLGTATLTGALGGAAGGALGEGAGAIGNKLMNAIYDKGNLTAEEAANFVKAKELGIPLGANNLAGLANSTPEQNAALTRAALQAHGITNIQDLKDPKQVLATEKLLSDQINTVADRLPVDMTGNEAQAFNTAMEHLYNGNLLDQDETGDIPSVRRSPARERIKQIQDALQQSAANSTAVNGNGLVSGRVVETLLSPGSPVRNLINSPGTLASTIGKNIKAFLEANQRAVAQRSGVDFDAAKAALTDANANYSGFKTIQEATKNNSENGTVLPQDLVQAVMKNSDPNNAMVRYNPKLKDLANIAKKFMVANPGRVAAQVQNPLKADAATSVLLGILGGGAGFVGQDPALGTALGLGLGGLKTAGDLITPRLRSSDLYTNNLLAAAQGQPMKAPVPSLPPQYVDRLRNALAGVIAQVPETNEQ